MTGHDALKNFWLVRLRKEVVAARSSGMPHLWGIQLDCSEIQSLLALLEPSPETALPEVLAPMPGSLFPGEAESAANTGKKAPGARLVTRVSTSRGAG